MFYKENCDLWGGKNGFLWQSVLDNLSDGIMIADVSGNVVIYNQAWADLALTGMEDRDFENMNVFRFPEMRNHKKIMAVRVLESRKTCIDIFQTPGRQVLLSTGRPIFDSEGKLQYVTTNIRDLSAVLSLRDTEANAGEIRRLYKKYIKEASQNAGAMPVVINPQMAAIYEKCMTVSVVDATVIILGESGTGKEVMANFIYRNSSRKDKPFLSINCGAIPENLLESELFGYEPGAFTGASRSGKIGIFEAADKGTLFLDEIGELSLAMQVKLLRVLETHKIIRIGSTKEIDIDVRLIAATNCNLAEQVKKGLFRSDLYYRINVISVTLPPLRERPEDVIALSNHFLDIFNVQYKRHRKISYDVFQRLMEYSWPGNVRELRNIIEQLVILSPEDTIPIDLVCSILPQYEGNDISGKIELKQIGRLDDVINDVEYQLFKLASEKYHTTRGVAKALGISQTTAVRKLNKYHLGTIKE